MSAAETGWNSIKISIFFSFSIRPLFKLAIIASLHIISRLISALGVKHASFKRVFTTTGGTKTAYQVFAGKKWSIILIW